MELVLKIENHSSVEDGKYLPFLLEKSLKESKRVSRRG